MIDLKTTEMLCERSVCVKPPKSADDYFGDKERVSFTCVTDAWLHVMCKGEIK